MPIQENNFWATTVDSPAVAASPELLNSVDVAVVGAGFCGLSAARTLAKRGVEVACKQSHFDGYEESAALIKREFDHDRRIIPKSELHAEIGSDIYFGGMV